ncbi:MAG TPA: ATP-binding protein [Verrucomicrobiae bacterium]|nr:ATP-binding protein [Verrucomicrobiae bacterium]
MSFYFKKRKVVARKILVGAALFLTGAVSFYLFSRLPARFFPSPWLSQPLFTVFLMTALCLVVYKPLDSFCSQFLKNYFFKKKSFRHITLMNLTEELALILDLNELANLVVNTFGEVMQLKSVALVVPSRVRGDFEIASAFGWNVSDYRRVRLPQDSPLLQMVRENGTHVIVRDRVVRMLAWQEANKLTHDFESLRCRWVIPLFVKKELTGLIAFSAQVPDAVFDESDFHFFREFAAPVATYIHNALSVQELRLANSELQDIQSQLIQSTKIKAIEQLATGIAHEIHNPLTIISGKAQVLLLKKDRAHMNDQVEEVLKTIVKQTKRAADITRKLLMFSQGSGAPKESLRLEQILEDTIALVSYQTSLDGIEITKSLRGTIPALYGNVHELREVFLNLILNAVQSIGSQGKIHIDMNYHARDEIIDIQISDTGQGIEAEHIDKLFNPFFTTRHDAVGLGLFVTKQIVHRYGGSIRAESRKGAGSLFIVRFPYLEASKPISSAEEKVSLTLFPET